jgi:transposase
LDVIQASKAGPRIMRYELTDFEWAAIRSFLPNKPRGVRRVDDRRVLNGIFWVLRSGAPWRDQQDMGRSRGGLTSKIHVVVDGNGLPVHLAISRVRRMTIGCVRSFSTHCFQRQCYSRIADTMRTGSGSLPVGKERGKHSAEAQSHRPDLLQPTSVSRAQLDRTGFSTRSSSAVASRLDMTSSRPTI